MYVVGNNSDSLYQYTLSTPFDLSTASYDTVAFDVSSQDSLPQGVAFNSNGSKMYVVGASNGSLYQYTLSTPFDLSTASYDTVAFDVSSQDSSPQGVEFNSNGSRMYVVGNNSDSLYQYTLSTPFDLSTAVFLPVYSATLTITSEGVASVISVSSDSYTSELDVLNALAAEVTGEAALSGVVTASVSGGQLLIDPAEGVVVTITNVSANLDSSFDKYVVDPTTGGGNVRYSFDLEATSAAVSQTIEYTSDTTPTITEILQGLSDQINNSGVFNTALVAGVDGNVLSITPNINQDVSLSSLTSNLINTVVGAETTEQALAEAAGEDDSWFFLSAEDKTPATQLALGRYAQANDKMYITTIPASTVATTAEDDIASQMRNAQLDNTHTLTVPDERLEEQAEGGVIGAIAAINPGESILAFKSMPGVSVTQFSSTEQNRIQGKNSNIYPLVNGVAVYDNGVNQSGLFFDDVRFGLWMKARIAEAVFGLLKRESDLGRKVVFGDSGFEQIRQVIYGQVINVAIRRNAILTPQDGVPAPVVRIPARSEIPTNDIANRTLRDVVVEFTYSGAIQRVFARVFILI